MFSPSRVLIQHEIEKKQGCKICRSSAKISLKSKTVKNVQIDPESTDIADKAKCEVVSESMTSF